MALGNSSGALGCSPFTARVWSCLAVIQIKKKIIKINKVERISTIINIQKYYSRANKGALGMYVNVHVFLFWTNWSLANALNMNLPHWTWFQRWQTGLFLLDVQVLLDSFMSLMLVKCPTHTPGAQKNKLKGVFHTVHQACLVLH